MSTATETKLLSVTCGNKSVRTVINGLADKSVDQKFKIKWWNNVQEEITIGKALAKMREMLEDDAALSGRKY